MWMREMKQEAHEAKLTAGKAAEAASAAQEAVRSLQEERRRQVQGLRVRRTEVSSIPRRTVEQQGNFIPGVQI